MTRAPTSITSATCAPSRAKSAERIEGAKRRSWSISSTPSRLVLVEVINLHGPEHAALTVIAGDDGRARHAHDRRVFAAVRAHRHELVALQAVQATVSTGYGRGPQPRF